MFSIDSKIKQYGFYPPESNMNVLDDMADVNLSSVENGDNIYYDSSTGTWKAIDSGFNAVSRWEDIIIYPTALRSGVSAPDLINFAGSTIQIYGFNGGSTTELLDGAFEIMHSYKEGTDLRPHIHWCPTTSNAGNVKWQLSYEIRNTDEIFTGVLTTVTAVDSSESTAWKNLAVEFGTISGVNLHIGAQCVFTLFRIPTDPLDTYPDDAGLLTFGLHFEIDSDGSKNVFSKQ